MVPNYMFATYREVTPAFLREKGIRNLLVDIDNTLAPYEQPEPDDNLREWLASLQEDGVKIALVSNNNRERGERFNVYYITKAVCQAVLLPVPETEIPEIPYDELM